MDIDFKPYSLNIKQKLYTINEPKVMGILNITGDSFFDGGRYNDHDNALKQVELMLSEGVDFIDIGGESTRPGAVSVSEEEELKRTIKVVESISDHFPEAILSIDTYKGRVAREAVLAGASIVNDVSAGEYDLDMLRTVADLKVPYIAVHKKGKPGDMQDNPVYENVCEELLRYFAKKKAECNDSGIVDMIIDVGFGFGKTTGHNYTLLRNLGVFNTLNCPLLAGISRKGMIWKALESDPGHALFGTVAANTIALLQGVHILRVHDVKPAKDAIRIVGMTKNKGF